jgi:hypothetical protein
VRRTDSASRTRALRLLRWYPHEWRARYGDEFVELLVDDMHERPHSPSRTFDIARNGLVARSAAAGLGGQPFDPEASERRSLVAVGTALVAFMVCALAMWAQLTIGWQWAAPDTVGTSLAMFVMSAAVVAGAALCLAAVLPIVGSVVRGLIRGQARVLITPLVVIVIGLVILGVGIHHFANGWPGTGGHPWVGQGIVPGGVAAYAWASTLFVTSYWAHPAALGGFPAAEVAWMLLSPVALVSVLVASAKVVHRLDLSPKTLRYERRLIFAGTIPMVSFFTGAAMWVFDGGPGPRNLFHIGAIDFVDLGAMALAIVLAGMAVRRIGRGARSLSPG